MLIAWFNTFTQEAGTCHCGGTVSQLFGFYFYFLERKRQINWADVRTPKVRAKPLLGFLIRRGVDGVANSLKLAHTKDPIILLLSENVMLTSPWCVIHFSGLVLILKIKWDNAEGTRRQGTKKKKKKSPLCQRRADWGSIKLNLISFSEGRAGDLKGEQMEWLNARSERCHGSLISSASSPSHRDNSSSGNLADRRLRSSWWMSPHM